MIDKIITVPKARLGKRIGQINGEDKSPIEPRVDSVSRAREVTVPCPGVV
ncbi:MAG: hypothetical protein ACLQFT_20335 [Steroidobacteraceae bacterium]|jgi:hypothetical protein